MQQLSDHASQRCPDCDAALSADDINIKEGFALCPECGSLKRLSELWLGTGSESAIIAAPPSGCTIVSVGQAVHVRASLRSIGSFVGAAFFALFWNSIVSVFVVLALAGLYANLVGPLPAWFPLAEGAGAAPKMNGEPISLGMTLFLCLFLTPFILVGLAMTAAAVISLVGHVEVVLEEFGSYVATGVGFVRWKRRFDARDVKAVSPAWSTWETNDQKQRQIELVADRPIKFGSQLRSDRIEWLQAVLHALLLGAKDRRSNLDLPTLMWLPPRR